MALAQQVVEQHTRACFLFRTKRSLKTLNFRLGICLCARVALLLLLPRQGMA